MIRLPGIEAGAFAFSPDSVWYAWGLLLFGASALSAITDTGSKSGDCALVRKPMSILCIVIIVIIVVIIVMVIIVVVCIIAFMRIVFVYFDYFLYGWLDSVGVADCTRARP
jgi:hypothetical protein